MGQVFERLSHGLPVGTRIGPVSGSWMSSLRVVRCIRTCAVRSGRVSVIVTDAMMRLDMAMSHLVPWSNFFM